MKLAFTVKYFWILCIAGWWASSGCAQKNRGDLILPEEQAALDSLTRNFFAEASSRGTDISTWRESVQVQFGTLERNHAGSCRLNSYPKIVTIDHFYWKIASFPGREQLLFHELAHCLLQRKHYTDTFAWGECKSWMREKDYDCLINITNPVWRKYYLDELFDEQPLGNQLVDQQPLRNPSWYLDTATPVAKAQYIKQSTIALTSPGSKLDSLFGNESGDWAIYMNFPPADSTDKPTYFGLTFNELALEYTNYNSTHRGVLAATVVTDSPARTLFRQNRGRTPFELSIQKHDNCAYLFLNDTLRYCLPLANDKLSITQYGAPSGKYVIDTYAPR